MQHITHDHVDMTSFEAPYYFKDLINGAQITMGVRHYNVPNSSITIHLNVEERGAAFSFKKGDKFIYMNTACLEKENSPYLFGVIKEFFKTHKLGKPTAPKEPTWLYTIPIARKLVSKEEVVLCNHIARAIFLGLYKARVVNPSN